MKKILVLSVAFLVTNYTFASSQSVPASASTALKARYPSATHVRWTPVSGSFEAKFESDNQVHRAFYGQDGRWLRTETKIHWTKNLPLAVRTSFRNSSYAAWDVDAIKEVETGSEHYVSIDVSLVTDYRVGGLMKDVYRLYFNMDGSFLRSEKVS